MTLSTDARLTSIPMDDDLSSLSAVLLDDSYYNYVIEHSSIEEGVHLANVESLICLKARAFIDLRKRKLAGENVDTKSIRKHKNDIFRLVTMLPIAARFDVPSKLQEDIRTFASIIEKELPDANFFKSIGLPNTKGESVFEQLLLIFDAK